MLPSTSLEAQEHIAETLQLRRKTMSAAERIAEVLVSAAFVLAVVLVWRFDPPSSFSLVPALVCFVLLIVAAQIRIDTPFGFTAPTQLAFVPLLFALPLAVVPVAVVAAQVIGKLIDVFSGKIRLSRLLHALPNSGYSIGPVAVFAIAAVTPQQASPGLLIAALAAQFVVDVSIGAVRNAMGREATVRDVMNDTWIYVVDAALSAVALLIAEQIHQSPIAALAPLPLLGLVAMFARERRQRLESLIELNGAYRRARDEAVEASNTKSAFLRNVSHEIRTPMNGVMGMTELLLQTPLNDEQRTYAEQVEQSGEHMLTIINDILDISQIETGRVELEVDEFDLYECVERACVPAGLEAHAKGVALDIEVDPEAPRRVRGDGARVRQVLMNLVGNAVKFTAEGSVRVRVVPRSEPTVNGVRFEVVDTGIGIAPAMLERMFEPFVQADGSTTRKYGGNGLGLSIAKELVELMGGLIGAESDVDQGSTFWVELPMERVATVSGQTSRERGVMHDERRPDPSAPFILVVEDSPVNRLVTSRVLERCGFRAHVVNDGQEALDALSMQSYDAVLMDCQMPELDGYEATRELRRREGDGHRTPVIAMTAHAMTGDRERCLAAGMDDYIAKPVRSQALVAVLGRWIAADRQDGPGLVEASPQTLVASVAAGRPSE
ncbi:MAG TPA: ATP-binding protein [Solirubrobacteraceae bacterium]|jgi:signal transduction histidine kinase/CheY-like chemotaxis protein